jgi:hypothetical protein
LFHPKNKKKKIYQQILMAIEKDLAKYLNIFRSFKKKRKNNKDKKK